MRILVVEDEKGLAAGLRKGLDVVSSSPDSDEPGDDDGPSDRP